MASHRSIERDGEYTPYSVRPSPSPDPSKLPSSASDRRAACEGDVYVVNAMSGERFHLTVTLQGPFHPLTSVTHASLQRTVRQILLASSSTAAAAAAAATEPPPTLLLEGMPLDESTTETLPNNAVIVVHRGVSVAGAPPLHRRSRTPSQPADGGIAVVEVLSGSLPRSPTARAVSMPALRPPSACNTAQKAKAAAAAASPTRTSPTTTAPSPRLPPRHANGHAAGSSAAKPPGAGSSTRAPSSSQIPSSTRTRTSGAKPIPSTPGATRSGPDFASNRVVKASATPPPPPNKCLLKSLREAGAADEEGEEGEYVACPPSVASLAKPLGVLQGIGVSAATGSAPSSMEQMASLPSISGGTQAPADRASTAAHTPSTSKSSTASPPPSPLHFSPKPTPVTSLVASPPQHNNSTTNYASSNTMECPWDRSKPPPVAVFLPSSPPSASSPSRPSTAFTSPAFSQTSPPSALLRSPPPPQPPTRVSGVETRGDKPVLALSAASPCRAAPMAPAPAPAVASSALFHTPRRAATAHGVTPGLSTQQDSSAAAPASALSSFTTVPPPPLPPHDSAAADKSQRLRGSVDALQAAYDAQKDAIVSAAAAEQQRLLTRLQRHCHALEAEKAELLAARLAGLRAQESASRLRVLRTAQEDAVSHEIDAARARLGQYREQILDHWLRVLHGHNDQHYAMSQELLRELETEGEQLSLRCLSAIAAYHTQKARLQALHQQQVRKEAEVAQLKWDAHVRRCTTEELRGCLRVVARVRPPLRRPWLPDWVLASAEEEEFDRGYAVQVPLAAATTSTNNIPKDQTTTTTAAAALPRCVEVVDPSRDVRRRFSLYAAYDSRSGTDGLAQQRLFKEQLQPLLEHMCRTGQRVAVLAFGAVGSGKTYTLIGPSVEPPPAPPSRTSRQQPRQSKGDATAAPNAATQGTTSAKASYSSRYSDSALSLSTVEDEKHEEHDVDVKGGGPLPRKVGNEAVLSARERHPHGLTGVGNPPRRGITRCLDPADEEMEMRVLQSVAQAEERDRGQRSSERHAREERRWRAQAGIDEEDGLLPRAVAWLTAHLRANVVARTKASAGPIVESVVFSMYEVYNDHVYDLLPTLPTTASVAQQEQNEEEGEGHRARRVVFDPSTWPRWNAGWLPAPHIKNSNPEQLTELQVELVPPTRRDSKDAAAALAQLQQQRTPTQSQWRVKASEVEVRSAAEALQAIQLGMQRRRSAATLRSTQSSRSHLFLRFRVEVQRPAAPEKASAAAAKASPPVIPSAFGAAPGGVLTGGAVGDDLPAENITQLDVGQEATKPKGYHFLHASLMPSSEASAAASASASAAAAAAAPAPTCVTELLFTDFAGSERVELGGAAGDSLKETQYINASLSSVKDVLIALARADPCRDAADGCDGASAATQKNQGGSTHATAGAAASLAERWGALISRPGVSLSRSPPVFLQPRFSKLDAGGRFGVSSSVQDGGTEHGLPLRRRVLSLMDTHVAGQGAAQWWRSWRASSPHIPFRTCKTTQLLQSALGAPCKTLVLACVRPCTVAEVVLPASMQHQRGRRARELALSLFDHQAPIILAEAHSTLLFADRINTATHESSTAAPARV
ncbi:putative kinesin [Leptomonas pyrrhocoris]|uniref:Putative kinesin n=1 Tax=Leptomonas pyrrhocoris TaxID=157538 RepID=A0A0M9FUR6_LEPPY|nr:putative kinesin [Leptomonas pyrrhocoris]KPA76495.1 putative kinesin [Leptomonas pyrrhocoris]|eukprot:XP_015654934.1 putative kinesin [Leptomonas pyrrhocoris]